MIISLTRLLPGQPCNRDPSRWRKSSYSGTSGNSCVETAGGGGVILVRDTTDREGFTLSVPADVWAASPTPSGSAPGNEPERPPAWLRSRDSAPSEI
ncbi:MAG: DUF397 domain-containing protein [Trebonia sp.]